MFGSTATNVRPSHHWWGELVGNDKMEQIAISVDFIGLSSSAK